MFINEIMNNEAASQPLNGNPYAYMTAPTIPGWYDVWWLDGQSQRVGQGPTLNLPGSNGVDRVYFYDTDAIGSLRQVTDANGAVIGRVRDFMPFGSEWNWDPSMVNDHKVSFAGKEHDPESNLDYFLARSFSTDIGRFMTPDASAFSDPTNPQSWNLYTYTYNNPFRYVDFMGNSPCPPGSQADFCSDTSDHAALDALAAMHSFFWESWQRLEAQLAAAREASRPSIQSVPHAHIGPLPECPAGTRQYGVAGSAAFGAVGTGFGGLVFDNGGNIGFYLGGGLGGGAGVVADLGFQVGLTNGHGINGISGQFLDVGGSAGAVAGGAVDVVAGRDQRGRVVAGVEGTGGSATGLAGWALRTNTWVWRIHSAGICQ